MSGTVPVWAQRAVKQKSVVQSVSTPHVALTARPRAGAGAAAGAGVGIGLGAAEEV